MQHDAYTKNERKLLDSIEGFISFSKKKKKLEEFKSHRL